MSTALFLTLILAQPQPKKQPPPAEPSKLGPENTAFPELQVPPRPDESPAHSVFQAAGIARRCAGPAVGDPWIWQSAAWGQIWGRYKKEIDALVFDHLLPDLPKDATLLQKVQYEQVRQGREFVQRSQETIEIGRWDANFFEVTVMAASDLGRVAGELHPTPAGRIRCHESRILMLKDFEEFISRRVAQGNQPPQDANRVRFLRLGAEADLLKLKAEIEKAGKK